MALARKAYKAMWALCNPVTRLPLITHGVAPTIEHSRLLKHLCPDVVIDVGANRGQFSLAVRSCCPLASIIALEPLASAANVFEAIFKNHLNVRLHRCAAGDSAGMVEINVSARPDSSSILGITKAQVGFFPGTEGVGVEEVSVERLDCLIGDLDLGPKVLLKIDVQGFELEVLKGAFGILDRINDVYVECSFFELYSSQPFVSDVIDYLSERGFGLKGVYNSCYSASGLNIQADFHFARRLPRDIRS